MLAHLHRHRKRERAQNGSVLTWAGALPRRCPVPLKAPDLLEDDETLLPNTDSFSFSLFFSSSIPEIGGSSPWAFAGDSDQM